MPTDSASRQRGGAPAVIAAGPWAAQVARLAGVRATDGVFLEVAQEVAAGYPRIQLDTANVDAICMWLLKNPANYDVIVTTNLFGDILSDLCAQLVGGMGFGYSGNIGDHYAVFEPTHGSAPKYAWQNKVNPLATILAAMMMLEWLGEKDKAEEIDTAWRLWWPKARCAPTTWAGAPPPRRRRKRSALRWGRRFRLPWQ